MNRIFIFLLTLGLHSGLCAASPPGDSYEQTLLDTIREIQSLDHDQALDSTRDLIKQYPHSRLGHMLYADLLLAKAEPLTEIGSGIEVDRAIQDFRYEIQQRWQHDSSQAHQDLYPESILFLAEDQPYVILVDQQSSRVYVYRNNAGDLQLETDYFITIGLKGYGKQKRGDQKTPIGVYHVTRYIDGMELPDLYGEGAFPIKYPNTWDLRKQRTGRHLDPWHPVLYLSYYKPGKECRLSYYLAPEEFFEDSEACQRWAGLAFDAALCNPNKKK